MRRQALGYPGVTIDTNYLDNEGFVIKYREFKDSVMNQVLCDLCNQWIAYDDIRQIPTSSRDDVMDICVDCLRKKYVQ